MINRSQPNARKIKELADRLWRAINSGEPPMRGADPQTNAYWKDFSVDKDDLASSLAVVSDCLSSLKKDWVEQNPTFSEDIEVNLCGHGKRDVLCKEILRVFFCPFVGKSLEIDLGDSWYPHGEKLQIGFKLRTDESCILGYPENPHYYFDDIEDIGDEPLF